MNSGVRQANPTATRRILAPVAPGGPLHLDPRTKLALVIGVGVVMSLPAPEPFLPVSVLLIVVLLGGERAWRRLGGFLATIAVLVVLAYLLPALMAQPLTGIFGYTAAYTLRFVLIAAVAGHLIATTSPAQLTASLRAARIPRAIVVPTAVTLRFLPVVATETRAVWDAMRLRGIAGSRDLLRHPLRSIELLTVPAIASTLRVGEDITASALLRGLGGTNRPTSAHATRFGIPDLAVVATVTTVAAFCWVVAQ